MTAVEPKQMYPSFSAYDNKGVIGEPGDSRYDDTKGVYADPNASCCVKLATAKLPDEDKTWFLEDEHNTFPQHVKADFTEIFLEPRDGKGWPAIVKLNGMVYHYTKLITYRILHVLLGWLLAFIWGLSLGIVTFFHVWIVQPTLKIFLTYIRLTSILVNASVRCMLDPVARALSLLYSRIAGKLSLDINGINNPQTKFEASL